MPVNKSELDRRTFLALGAGVLGVAAAPAWMRPRERLVRLTLPVMGTVGELAVPARHEGMARQALSAAGAELRRIERLMTRFTHDSDVGRFNGAPTGARVVMAPETAEVVRAALEWAEATEGGFDPTLGRLAVLWDPAHVRRPPDRDALQAARAEAGGWRAWGATGPGTGRKDARGRWGSGTRRTRRGPSARWSSPRRRWRPRGTTCDSSNMMEGDTTTSWTRGRGRPCVPPCGR